MASVMDRPIERSFWQRHGGIIAGGALVAALGLAVLIYSVTHSERSVRVAASTLVLSRVETGVFRDFVTFRAKVVPRETVYLDALEGGRVDQVLVEPGDFVAAGQPLVKFSNTELELDVLEREGRLIESITQLQAYETQLEQNHLANVRALEQIDYNITRLSRLNARRKPLAEHGLVTAEERDAIQDELDYDNRLRPVQAQSNAEQDRLRLEQLPQIRAQLEKLQQDVQITRSKLDNLTVRSPVAGRMTAIDLKVGENRNRGDRLGEITPETGFKLSAQIDEYYLGRLRKGQIASARIGEHDWTLHVARVYPQVKEGAFTIDLAFDAKAPDGLIPGEAVQGKVTLGSDVKTMVLPSGAFLERTGGDWAFVLDPDRTAARKRRIKLGRRNVDQLEVLGGLRAGEDVITSDYSGLERAERLTLTR